MPDIPARIAQLIRQNPTITARQLADALGYSEVKSVYYWLNKANFTRLQDFRSEVLRGNFPPYPSAELPAPLAGETSEPSLPLMDGFAPDGTPVPTGDWASRAAGIPAGSFAWRVPGDDYLPLFRSGDLLLVDPAAGPTPGRLLLGLRGAVRLYRCYRRGGEPLLVPLDGSETVPAEGQVRPLGVVRGLLRSL